MIFHSELLSGPPGWKWFFISNLYPPPAGSNPAASIQNVGRRKGVNIQTYRHKDADIEWYRYRIYIGHIHYIYIYIYIYDDQAQSASTEDASVEAVCHNFLDIIYSYIDRIFKEIYFYIYMRIYNIIYIYLWWPGTKCLNWGRFGWGTLPPFFWRNI